MDILSQETLTLLRDTNVSKAVDELLDQRTTDSKTVELTNKPERADGPTRPGTRLRLRVRIRRIA